MANARQAALAARRTSGFGDSIRILAPVSTGISSIAKQNAANETDIMIAKYNAGQVGNEEMKTFFQTQLANPNVSAADKTQIQTKLLDFDVLIEKDRLEAVFKQAPENSIQKAQAATALANFYTQRASTMVAGTQAHSQALENAGVWQQNVLSIQDSTNKEQQKNYKNQMLQVVNAIPDGSQKAQAASQMWDKLAALAGQQGDVESQQMYLANKQTEIQNSIAYKQTEANTADRGLRKDTIDDMAEKKVLYETGQITKDQYYQYLDSVNIYATNNQDGTLQNTILNEVTRVEKDSAKGKGGQGVGIYGSLMAKAKGTGAGGGSLTNFDAKMYTNTKQLRDLDEKLRKGEITSQKYQEMVGKLITEKSDLINGLISEFENVADTKGPNAKVQMNGTKDVTNALDMLYADSKDAQAQADAVASGNAVMLVVEPSATGEGVKSLPEIKFINKNNVDETMAFGTDNSYHFKEYDEIQLSPEDFMGYGDTEAARAESIRQQMGNAIANGGYVDKNNQWRKITVKNGVPLRQDYDKKFVKYFDLSTGEAYKDYLDAEGRSTKDFNTLRTNAISPGGPMQPPGGSEWIEVKPNEPKATPSKTATNVPYGQQAGWVKPSLQSTAPPVIKPTPTIGEQIQQNIIKPVGQELQNFNTNVVQPMIQKAPSAVQNVAKVVTSPSFSNAPTPYIANKIVQTVKPVVQQVQQTAQRAAATPLSQPVQQVVNNGPIGTILKASLGVQSAVKNAASNVWNKIKWW